MIKFLLIFFLFSCSSEQINMAKEALLASDTPSSEAFSKGMKEALKMGAESASLSLSSPEKWIESSAHKIIFPKEAQKIESTLRKIGLGAICYKTIQSFNEAAANAAKSAAPVFVNAIQNMSVTDAKNIITGPANAATSYLKTNTWQELKEKFIPIIQTASQKSQLTKYWPQII